LELKVRSVVEGFMVGLHKSPYHGFSSEFSQHRPYMQGDPIKNIDWKLYGKSEKYFTKQFEEDTNLLCHILVDVSKSMDYKNKGLITKSEYSTVLAASLSFIMNSQQDSVGMAIFSDKIESYLPPKSHRVQLKNIFSELEKIHLANKTDAASCLKEVITKIKKRGLVIIISDFFDDIEKVLKAIKLYKTKNNEVIVFQILDPIEKNFAFSKDGIFVDIESGEEITTFATQIQKSYQDKFSEFLSRIKSECMMSGIEYNLLLTSDSYDKALLSYFRKRLKLI